MALRQSSSLTTYWASSIADTRQRTVRKYLRWAHPIGGLVVIAASLLFAGPNLGLLVAATMYALPTFIGSKIIPDDRLVTSLGTIDLLALLGLALFAPELWLMLLFASFGVVPIGWSESARHTCALWAGATTVGAVVTLVAAPEHGLLILAGFSLQSIVMSMTAFLMITAQSDGLRHLGESLRSLSIVIWQADDQGRVTRVSGKTEEFLGASASELVGTNVFAMLADESDRREWKKASEKMIDGKSSSFVHKVNGTDGIHTVRTTLQRNRIGKTVTWQGVGIDITDQWQKGLHQRRNASIVDHMSDGLIIVNAKRGGSQRPSTINARAHTILGIGDDLTIDEIEAIHPSLRPLIPKGEVVGGCARSVQISVDGRPRWLNVQCYKVAGSSLAIQFDDETDRKLAHDKAEHAARHDPLTGIANRAELHRRLESRMAEHEGTGRSELVAFLLDLDRFKPVNDEHGHGVGDVVLSTVAERIDATLREGDLVGRIGGDEFGGFMSVRPDPKQLEATRRRLEDACSAPVVIDDLTVDVGASVGFAVWTGAESAEKLLDLADKDMYQQKALAPERRRTRADDFSDESSSPAG